MINELIFIGSCLITALLTLAAVLFGIQGLTAAIALQVVLENLFVVKQITLFGLEVTATDVFAVGLMFAFNLLQEFYGKTQAMKAIGLYLFVANWFLLASIIQLWFIPSINDCTHQSFCQILSTSPRIIGSSIFTLSLSLILDRRLYGWLRAQVHDSYAWIINMVTISCAQLVDTVLFTFLALQGSVANPWQVIFFSYLVKLLVIACTTPFAFIARPFFNWQQRIWLNYSLF